MAINISSIDLVEDINDEEAQTVSGGAASTFQNSCQDIDIVTNNRGVFIVANCRRIDGSFNQTQIEVTDIENINGVLT